MSTEKAALLPAEWVCADPPHLRGGRCDACGGLRFPVVQVCARCQSTQISAVPLSTTGVIYAYTVVRASPPGYAGKVPYGLGIVELPEGLRVESTLTAHDLTKIAIGDMVSFELIQLGSGVDAVTSFAYRHGGVYP
jgi:uncharacterized OB-fold protein